MALVMTKTTSASGTANPMICQRIQIDRPGSAGRRKPTDGTQLGRTTGP